jgi:hypothetical protein
MSSVKQNEVGRNSLVIGRAFGDEPIVLIPISDWGAAIEVRREGDRDSIGFSKESVYRFDQDLFNGLRAAFGNSDRKTLLKLWNNAAHYA